MRIADTLSIGISNAHGGNEIILVATPDRGSFIYIIQLMPIAECPTDCRCIDLAIVDDTRVVILTADRNVGINSSRECDLITESILLSIFRPRFRREHPLNLSILLSGGKENNNDSPSKGD